MASPARRSSIARQDSAQSMKPRASLASVSSMKAPKAGRKAKEQAQPDGKSLESSASSESAAEQMGESSEDDVEREKEESFERLQTASGLVEQQEFIYNKIMDKIAEYEQGDSGAANGSHDRHDVTPGQLPPEALRMLAETTATGERREHAQIVAEELLRRQMRYAKYKKNHDSLLEQEEKQRKKVEADQMLAEERRARRQHEMRQARREKTFAAQQKRSEQQKMLKEIQRDQDHQFEVLQQKHYGFLSSASHHPSHSMSSTLPALPTGARGGKSSGTPQGRPGSSPQTLDRSLSDSILHEQIYKDICKSRALYNSEFERWEKRAQENERRTEAHWRKMLHGGKQPKDEESKKGRNLFKRAVKEVKTIKTFVQKAPFERCDFRKGSPMASPTGSGGGEDDATDVSFPPIVSSPHSTTSSAHRNSPKNERWHHRFQRCQTHQALIEENNLEKKANDEKRLHEAVQRQKSFNLQRAAEASSMIDEWQRKCETAELARQSTDLDTSDFIEQKHEEWAAKWQEEQARLTEERLTLAESRKALRGEIKEELAKHIDETESALKAKLAEKDANSAAALQQNMEQHERRADQAEHIEIARAKKQHKKQSIEEFRRKTEKELAAKERRSKNVIKSNAKPPSTKEALERHRVRRQEAQQKVALQPKELILPPELALAPNLLLSKKLKAAAAPVAAPEAAQNSTDPAGEVSGADDTSAAVSAPVSPALTSPASYTANPTDHRRSTAMTTDFSSWLAEEDSDAGSDFMDGEVSGEQEFISKLKDWSTTELQKLRKDEDERPSKSY